jgi:hypothetical protein
VRNGAVTDRPRPASISRDQRSAGGRSVHRGGVIELRPAWVVRRGPLGRRAVVWDFGVIQFGLPFGFAIGMGALGREPAMVAPAYWCGAVLLVSGVIGGIIVGYVVGWVRWSIVCRWRRHGPSMRLGGHRADRFMG